MKQLGIVWKSLALAVGFLSAGPLQAQSFSSSSNGLDGALSLTAPGTIYFDPTLYNPTLHQDGNTVYDWTTITIGPGVTVILSAQYLAGPVYWLANGDVNISGSIILNGQDGHSVTSNGDERVPSIAGAGGFGGGLGGKDSVMPATPGNGPGHGAAGNPGNGTSGTFTGNQYLMPLVGGSGGGGDSPGCTSSQYGGGGGAGGGAILIASSTSISLTGATISANGGNGITCGGAPGGGSGGAIRLVAPQVGGDNISLSAVGGAYAGSVGVIRVESLNHLTGFSATVNPPILLSVPYAVSPPAVPSGQVLVTSIAGTTVNANPFTFPDAMINTGNPVPVNITAHNIPVGATPTLYIFSESGPDMTIPCGAPLAGTLETSTCTASLVFPTGGSRGYVKAIWAPPSGQAASRLQNSRQSK